MDSSDISCVYCSSDKKNIKTFCLGCREFYCNYCLVPHGRLGATKKHCTINLSTGEISNLGGESVLICDGCESTVTHLCAECRELLCSKCHVIHSKSKISKQHQVTALLVEAQEEGSVDTQLLAQIASDFEEAEMSSDFEGTVVLSGGVTDEVKVVDASRYNVTTPSVTNMAYIRDLDPKLDSDKEECKIAGIAFLSDGRFVVVDNNNMNIKVYSDGCKYLYSVQYSGYMYGITVVSTNTLVVIACPTLRYLHLDAQHGVMLDNRINIPRDALAVSYASQMFAVLCPWSRRVVMFNDNGVEQTVVKLSQIKGDPAPAILLDSSGTRFYICDENNHRIFCYSCQPGHTGVLWGCSVSPYPHSILHVRGNLVVVCQKKVYMINNSGENLHELVVNLKNFDIFHPVAAYYTKCTELAIASYWTGDKVQIYHL